MKPLFESKPKKPRLDRALNIIGICALSLVAATVLALAVALPILASTGLVSFH